MTAADCLARFKAAVREGRRGQYGAASEIVERVRQKAGDEAAERAKKEIWNYIKSDKRA
ncbi:hypothetical protein [Burkholderia vietnamiensis]|uniref:hypothetical protein n=1 Tax=Burkholderia vietnamiensis TaxID=60552 RepID=UPI001CF24CF6|nr:hypothetical protein [Burkholderia vietnamiensis]MCA7945617.1 hypothetical protein [Burkholderia vietnamiensis]